MKERSRHKQETAFTGKHHIQCQHRDKTGINIDVVIKDGCCYRSDDCMIVWCKFNRLKTDIDSILSLIW